MVIVACVFFFSSRRRHTRYWRDWSSDVCSSNLYGSAIGALLLPRRSARSRSSTCPGTVAAGRYRMEKRAASGSSVGAGAAAGTASDRKSVGEGKGVDLGGRRIIKKKKNNAYPLS